MINIYRNKIFNSKFLSLFLCLIMFSVSIGLGNFSYAQLQYATSFSTSSDLLGNGSSDDPYQITDAKHLQEMQDDNKKSSCFILLKNIEVQSHNPIKNFKGTFDGNGFTITINAFKVSTTNMGLFGSAIGATIKNVNVIYSVRGSISFPSIGGAEVGYFGGICASATASATKKCIIENCNNFSVNISFSSKGTAIGGIVGTGSPEIKNCTNRSNLTMITGEATYYGGIVGYSTNKISYCSNYGDIFGTATYAGGIVGRLSADLTHCYNLSLLLKITNKTSSPCYIGGIVGMTSGEVECSTNDANIKVTTNTNIAYVGGIAGQSNGLFCLSNNGDVTLNTTGYKFWLGGISGQDTSTDTIAQLISCGDVKIDNDTFDEEEADSQCKLGGVIGQSVSNRFSYIYCSGKVVLDFGFVSYPIGYENEIFENIGLLIGMASKTYTVTCDYCYYMGEGEYYIGEYPREIVDVVGNCSVIASELYMQESIYVNLNSYFSLKPFGNITPNNKQGTVGLKAYYKSTPLYMLEFNANQTIDYVAEYVKDIRNQGLIYYYFFNDKVVFHRGGDDRQTTLYYTTNNGINYLSKYDSSGVALLYLWQELEGFRQEQFSVEKIDNQEYFLRGGRMSSPYADLMYYTPFNVRFTNFNQEKISNCWNGNGPLSALHFDYIGPLSIVKNGSKCKFNLNFIDYGPKSFRENWSGSYIEWQEARMDFYAGEWIQDTYTFVEFDLSKNDISQFASNEIIKIDDIGRCFTSNFQNTNGNYYVVNFWK